jgi:putative lipoic acid-binding regulatory protein
MTQKAKIDYPTSWTYKIIATSVTDIEHAVSNVLKDKKRSLKPSKTSKKGRFISMDMITEVLSEKERTDTFHEIYGQPGIKMVL